MSESSAATVKPATPRSRLGFLWQRSLAQYPNPGRRYFYLGIVVLVTIVLYYSLYIQYGVAPSIMGHFGMSFTFFIWISVIGNLVGAFASLVAGLGDRWGRANFTVYGLLLVAVLLFLLAYAPGKYSFLIIVTAIFFVEGMVLVSTPALIRDFSPQVGRASAMGFWTMGPVLGSLLVTAVTSLTLGFSDWQDELLYAGYLGLAVFVVALFGLKELSLEIRGQILVSLRDRALIEARARQARTTTQSDNMWRDVLRPNVVGPAFGISVYLLFYYAAVGNLVIYFTTTFGYTEQAANTLATCYWATNALALLGAGFFSDRLKVRKPFMLVGALGSIIMGILFTLSTTRPETSFTSFIVLFIGMGAFGGLTYAPWMASFTETVESYNPGATAIGLAVWGWIIRIVVAASAAAVPLVVTSVTPLVEHGAQVEAAYKKAAPALAIVKKHQKLFHELSQYAPGEAPAKLSARAKQEVGKKKLARVRRARPDIKVVKKYGPAVAKARTNVAGQWQFWWWICVFGMVIFMPFVFMMVGRWRPKAARKDMEEHERAVERELASLQNR